MFVLIAPRLGMCTISTVTNVILCVQLLTIPTIQTCTATSAHPGVINARGPLMTNA